MPFSVKETRDLAGRSVESACGRGRTEPGCAEIDLDTNDEEDPEAPGIAVADVEGGGGEGAGGCSGVPNVIAVASVTWGGIGPSPMPMA